MASIDRVARELNVPESTVRRIAHRLVQLDGATAVWDDIDHLSEFGTAAVKRQFRLMQRTSSVPTVVDGRGLFRQCDGDPGAVHQTRLVDTSLIAVSDWQACDQSCGPWNDPEDSRV